MKTKEEIEEKIEECKKKIEATYLDEIHRFYRGYIDALLWVQDLDLHYWDVE